MKIIVIDGQGGGVGRALIERIKQAKPDASVIALGTNAAATMAMLRAGADAGATGENAIRVNCADAEIILGPIGIVIADALMGEVTAAMAVAVGSSKAVKLLVPIGKCSVNIVGMGEVPLSAAVESAAEKVLSLIEAQEGSAGQS